MFGQIARGSIPTGPGTTKNVFIGPDVRVFVKCPGRDDYHPSALGQPWQGRTTALAEASGEILGEFVDGPELSALQPAAQPDGKIPQRRSRVIGPASLAECRKTDAFVLRPGRSLPNSPLIELSAVVTDHGGPGHRPISGAEDEGRQTARLSTSEDVLKLLLIVTTTSRSEIRKEICRQD